MRTVKKFLFLLAAFLLLSSAKGFAKMISGKIVSVDSSTRKVTVSILDAVTGKENRTDVWVNPDAEFRGAKTLGELKPNESVWIEADADPEGNLRGSKVAKA